MTVTFFLLLLISCNEDDMIDKSIYFGSSSAYVDNELWEADVRSSYCTSDNNYILLSFDMYEGSILRNELYMKKVKLSIGELQYLNQDLDNSCEFLCASLSTGFDDQAGDYYTINQNNQLENWIIIDSFYNQTLEFWGRYQASFLRDDRIPKMDNYPDTLYFEAGSFNGRIRD